MAHTRHKETILIVDDDPDWRAFTAAALSPRYDVALASNGSDGMRIAKSTRPAAIVLDVLMAEGEDGFRVLCELRRHPDTRNTPIVLFSNVNEKTLLSFTADEIRAQIGVGPDVFLEKPADAETVCRTVAEVVARRGSESDAPRH